MTSYIRSDYTLLRNFFYSSSRYFCDDEKITQQNAICETFSGDSKLKKRDEWNEDEVWKI